MQIGWTVLASLFFAGLLAGEEFVIRFGVRGPLARLDQRAHIAMRQGLIRTLRVLVPVVFGLTLSSGIAAVVAGWGGDTVRLRMGSVGLLVAFITVTLVGTARINQAAGRWDPADPPPGWQDAIRRWERLDDIRTVLAIGAFALALLGVRG